jgi:hypothetical protein
MEIRMAEALAKIKPTEPLRLAKQAANISQTCFPETK